MVKARSSIQEGSVLPSCVLRLVAEGHGSGSVTAYLAWWLKRMGLSSSECALSSQPASSSY